MGIDEEMRPEILEIEKGLRKTWDYEKSKVLVRKLYLGWRTLTSEILQELWDAKQELTNDGSRSSGKPKSGEMSWSRYVELCFEGRITKRSIDSYLKAYENNGYTKPDKLTKSTVSTKNPVVTTTNHDQVILRKITLVGNCLSFEIYSPEFNRAYLQSVQV